MKALAFQALEIPGGDAVHYFLQRHLTGNLPRPVARLDGTAAIAARLIDIYQRYLGSPPRSVIEIGAGRDLAVPLALRVAGVKQVSSYDIHRLARLDLVRHAARHLAPQYAPMTWDALESYGIRYRAPAYAQAGEPPADCSCSNQVLEHIPTDQLPIALAGLCAVTEHLTVHEIDYSDHYARTDGKLSRHHFLRFSDAEWHRFNPSRHFVNRLRHSDYLNLFKEAGFEILEETTVTAPIPAPIQERLADRFRHYEQHDLSAIKGTIVARPKS